MTVIPVIQSDDTLRLPDGRKVACLRVPYPIGTLLDTIGGEVQLLVQAHEPLDPSAGPSTDAPTPGRK